MKNILLHIDPLLGNDHETNETTPIDMQEIRKHAIVLDLLLGSDPCAIIEILLEAVFSTGRFEAISLEIPS
jgi:hypothetical protein